MPLAPSSDHEHAVQRKASLQSDPLAVPAHRPHTPAPDPLPKLIDDWAFPAGCDDPDESFESCLGERIEWRPEMSVPFAGRAQPEEANREHMVLSESTEAHHLFEQMLVARLLATANVDLGEEVLGVLAVHELRCSHSLNRVDCGALAWSTWRV